MLDEGYITRDSFIAHDRLGPWEHLSDLYDDVAQAFGGRSVVLEKEDVAKDKVTIVKMSLNKAMKYPLYGRLFHVISQKMTRIRWYGTRALTHFVLNEVLINEYEIDDKAHLTRIVRMCFTALSKRGYRESLACCSNLMEKWLSFNRDTVRIDTSGMGQIITFAVSEYIVCLENYLRYGIRAHYVKLLWTLEKPFCKRVAVRVLKASCDVESPTFQYKLSSEDFRESNRKCRNAIDERNISLQTDAELNYMGRIASYADGFCFIQSIQERFHLT